MSKTLMEAVNKYLLACKNDNWLIDESDKFLFANYVNSKTDFEKQSNKEVFDILLESQNIRYTGQKGIKFILKSGQEKPGHFLNLSDVSNLRLAKDIPIDKINWAARAMSFTGGISVWIATLYPHKYYPIPMKGFNEVVRFLYNPKVKKFPKIGMDYVLECQPYCRETQNMLSKFPLEDIYLNCWNNQILQSSNLSLGKKNTLNQIDWVWLVQDFYLFVLDRLLGNFKKNVKVQNNSFLEEPETIEGDSKLAVHMRYERNQSLIKRIKQLALKENKMLNCEVCNFSFFANYGEMGLGFIEAHHINPLSERNGAKVTKMSDIALVCSNCHRMLHRNGNISIEELKKKLIQ